MADNQPDNIDSSPPSIQDLAGAAEAAYSEDAPVMNNYTKLTQYSSPDISTFKHNEKSEYLIAHRGTDLANKNSASKDIRSDLNIALGNKEGDALHKRRTKQTEAIIKGIRKESPKGDIYLTGHSLAGSTAAHAMATSKVVRDNVKELHTFNSGSSKFQKPPDVSTDVKAELMLKSTHHHIRGDLISDHVKSNLIGKHKEYESKKKPGIADHILKLARPLLKRTFIGKAFGYGAKKVLDTLRAHSISNFTRG
jgi:hypothetical protein